MNGLRSLKMIRINLKEFIRQRFWFGMYFWHECEWHQLYKSDCKQCNNGGWTLLESGRSHGYNLRWYDYTRIYKMKMNGVLWHDNFKNED